MKKRWAVLGAAVGLAATAGAQAPPHFDARLRAERTLEVREHSALERGRWEVGVVAAYEDQDAAAAELFTVTPYARHGLTRNLRVRLDVPVAYRDREIGGEVAGPGDLRLGAELLVHEDSFRFPYVLPYLSVSFPTGSSGDGLGLGDAATDLGIALGTTRWRDWHFRLDARYALRFGDLDNIASVGGALIWDVNPQFAVLAEGRISQGDVDDTGTPKVALGGMVYRPSPRWSLSVHGGMEFDGTREALAAVRVAYRLPGVGR